jgi:nicotinate-nucleotide pyrophosphorylase
VTTEATIHAESRSTAVFIAKQELVLAGLEVSREVFRQLDSDMKFEPFARDGARIGAGTEIAKLAGSTRVLLAGERVALNLLQHMSGIATLLEALKAARERSVKLRLTGMSGQARTLAEIAQLDTIFRAWGSEVEFR